MTTNQKTGQLNWMDRIELLAWVDAAENKDACGLDGWNRKRLTWMTAEEARKLTRLFNLGSVLITAHVREELNFSDAFNALLDHANGIWGNSAPHLWQENDFSVGRRFELFSVFRDRRGLEF